MLVRGGARRVRETGKIRVTRHQSTNCYLSLTPSYGFTQTRWRWCDKRGGSHRINIPVPRPFYFLLTFIHFFGICSPTTTITWSNRIRPKLSNSEVLNSARVPIVSTMMRYDNMHGEINARGLLREWHQVLLKLITKAVRQRLLITSRFIDKDLWTEEEVSR